VIILLTRYLTRLNRDETIQRTQQIRLWHRYLNGNRTHQNKLHFYLPFLRKVKLIFTVFRVIESFMNGMVKEQWLRTKKINAQKGLAKTY
jgi:hypothetical protein